MFAQKKTRYQTLFFYKDSNDLNENEKLNDQEINQNQDVKALHDLFFSAIKTRQDILNFEEFIRNMPTAFDECPYPLFHFFADGMYTREIHINKGDLVVGAIHRNDYFVNVLKGRLWVVSEFGSWEIIAPASFSAKAGVKHIVFTIEDTVWTDIHRTNKTSVAEAEKEIFVESYKEFDRCKKVHEVLGLSETDEALKNYKKFDDIVKQPESFIVIKQSEIDGLGVFAKREISEGEKITARIKNSRTYAGRYVNHSEEPNSEAITEDDMGFFLVTEKISRDSEITVNYSNVRDCSKSLDRFLLCQDGLQVQ